MQERTRDARQRTTDGPSTDDARVLSTGLRVLARWVTGHGAAAQHAAEVATLHRLYAGDEGSPSADDVVRAEAEAARYGSDLRSLADDLRDLTDSLIQVTMDRPVVHLVRSAFDGGWPRLAQVANDETVHAELLALAGAINEGDSRERVLLEESHGRVLQYLTKRPSKPTLDLVAEDLGMGKNTVQKAVQALQDLGLLRLGGTGRTRAYVITARGLDTAERLGAILK